MKLSTLILYLFFLITSIPCFSQPFAYEIQAFRNQDKSNSPPANAILFVGSSSFRKWTDVSSYFPGFTIINRGFGGSTRGRYSAPAAIRQQRARPA